MTCRVEGCEQEGYGGYRICSRHRYLRDHHGSVDATPPKGRSQEDVMAFAARLGDEMRARKVSEMPVGSLGWMVAGDAAWRAAIGHSHLRQQEKAMGHLTPRATP